MTLSHFQNWKIRTLILILILFITQHSFSQEQEKTEINDKIPVYKNSLKGFAFAFPIYGASISLGYERAITKHSTIELGTYYRFFFDEMGLEYHTICIMPAYNGIGGAIGKRINLNKNHSAFLDVGFGISYNYYTDKSIFSTIDWWSNIILYRPIIQFGWKF